MNQSLEKAERIRACKNRRHVTLVTGYDYPTGRRLAICSFRDFAAVALCFISFYETALSIISLIIPKIPIAFITISSIRDVR